MFNFKKKSIIIIALLACLVFVVGFYSLKGSNLPKGVDKALKRNGIEKYTLME